MATVWINDDVLEEIDRRRKTPVGEVSLSEYLKTTLKIK